MFTQFFRDIHYIKCDIPSYTSLFHTIKENLIQSQPTDIWP